MMRKYIIGALFGLLLGLSATTYADEAKSLIGHKVQGERAIYNDGREFGTAIIVDGESYTPTRALAEESGKRVTFSEGGIYLETQESVGSIESPGPLKTEGEESNIRTDKMTLERVESEIRIRENSISEISNSLEAGKLSGDDAVKARKYADRFEKDLVKLYKKKAELESQQ